MTILINSQNTAKNARPNNKPNKKLGACTAKGKVNKARLIVIFIEQMGPQG